MRIEIRKRADKGYNIPVVYEVCIVDDDGQTIRTFTYQTIEAARRAARAWTGAYGNCTVIDKSGEKK
jgi:hypothetical protein